MIKNPAKKTKEKIFNSFFSRTLKMPKNRFHWFFAGHLKSFRQLLNFSQRLVKIVLFSGQN